MKKRPSRLKCALFLLRIMAETHILFSQVAQLFKHPFGVRKFYETNHHPTYDTPRLLAFIRCIPRILHNTQQYLRLTRCHRHSRNNIERYHVSHDASLLHAAYPLPQAPSILWPNWLADHRREPHPLVIRNRSLATHRQPRSSLRHWFRLAFLAHDTVSRRMVHCAKGPGIRYHLGWEVCIRRRIPLSDDFTPHKVRREDNVASMGRHPRDHHVASASLPQAKNPRL